VILLEDVLTLHDFSIKDFGGLSGVRDLYPSPISKAAAVGESLIINHPFLDGNKRTGLLLVMIALLKEYNIQVNASNDSLYQFTISHIHRRKKI
jgi:death on curing protein